jgi:hypothetical protein
VELTTWEADRMGEKLRQLDEAALFHALYWVVGPRKLWECLTEMLELQRSLDISCLECYRLARALGGVVQKGGESQ